MVFHVLNRGVARMQLFEKAGDYEAFERVLSETLQEAPMRIGCYCVMPITGTCSFGRSMTGTWRGSCSG
jgi:hypothetical protein